MSKNRNKEPLSPETAAPIVEAFIIRARRIQSHSMVQSGAVRKLASPSMKLHFSENGSVEMQEQVPENEEIFESLAARVRPLTLEREPVYFPTVVSAILTASKSASEYHKQSLMELKEWFNGRVIQKTTKAYAIQVFDKEDEPVTGYLSDNLIAECWLYSDLVHANPNKKKAQALELRYEDRYIAATSYYCDIAVHALKLLKILREMIDAGELSGIGDKCWTDAVTASTDGSSYTKTVELHDVYVGPAGSVPPSNGPISEVPGFQKATFTWMRRMVSPQSRAECVLLDESGGVVEKHPAFFNIKDNAEIYLFIDDALMISAPLPSSELRKVPGTKAPISIGFMGSDENDGRKLLESIAASSQTLIVFAVDGQLVSLKLNLSRTSDKPDCSRNDTK